MVAIEKKQWENYTPTMFIYKYRYMCSFYCAPGHGSSHGRLITHETSIHWEFTACFSIQFNIPYLKEEWFKLLVDAGFQYDKAPIPAVMLRYTVKLIICVHLYCTYEKQILPACGHFWIMIMNKAEWGPQWHSGLGTVLQIGRSLVRFQTVSLEFFIDIILLFAPWHWGWLSILTEMSTRNISWG
jgi:hypothetical protein